MRTPRKLITALVLALSFSNTGCSQAALPMVLGALQGIMMGMAGAQPGMMGQPQQFPPMTSFNGQTNFNGPPQTIPPFPRAPSSSATPTPAPTGQPAPQTSQGVNTARDSALRQQPGDARAADRIRLNNGQTFDRYSPPATG